MRSYLIRAELARRFDADDDLLDPETAHGPRIRELKPTVQAQKNRIIMTLTIESADLWTAMLTCMAYLEHNSYELTSWSAGPPNHPSALSG
ncbi:MAG TPA: hypothetical protein VFP34_16030 [Microlunatus sp.]|nr:hypothetical protein [Microlunatus sp.]